MDCYHGRNTAAFISNVKSISELSKMLMKPVGVTETGLENNHTADYWTKNVLEPLIGSNCVMVVAWRNEKTSHAFGPFLQISLPKTSGNSIMTATRFLREIFSECTRCLKE